MPGRVAQTRGCEHHLSVGLGAFDMSFEASHFRSQQNSFPSHTLSNHTTVLKMSSFIEGTSFSSLKVNICLFLVYPSVKNTSRHCPHHKFDKCANHRYYRNMCLLISVLIILSYPIALKKLTYLSPWICRFILGQKWTLWFRVLLKSGETFCHSYFIHQSPCSLI